MIDLGGLDPYVRWVLRKNGWTPGREFPLAEAWLKEITALGFPAVDYGVQVLRSLGALRFREYQPESYRRLVQSWRERGLPPDRWPEAAEIRESCQTALAALEGLGLDAAGYKGAAFTFDALEAARDRLGHSPAGNRRAHLPRWDGGAGWAGFRQGGRQRICAV